MEGASGTTGAKYRGGTFTRGYSPTSATAQAKNLLKIQNFIKKQKN